MWSKEEILNSDLHLLDKQVRLNLMGYEGEAWNVSQELWAKFPNDPRVAFNRGWHLLKRDKFKEGFDMLYQGRNIQVFGSPPVNSTMPIWDGKEDLDGKFVLFNGEGGLGDEIINARFVSNLAALGAKVTLTSSMALAPVLSRIKGVQSVVLRSACDSVFHDYWIPAMSAPGILNLSYSNLPNKPYITANPNFIKKWSSRMFKGGPKIGIRWKGNPKFEHEQHRVFPPKYLFDLEKIKGLNIFSLQRDTGVEDLPQDTKIQDLSEDLKHFEDTAAVIHHLDLVITSCTSVAHLASAMGKETWVIVPALSYYIWSHPGDVSRWYMNTKLLRQKEYGDWTFLNNLTEMVKEKFGRE